MSLRLGRYEVVFEQRQGAVGREKDCQHACPKTRRTLPNIYYCTGLANNSLGILRAVMSWEESRNFLKLCSVQYAGLQFPTMAQGRASDFAVLRILDDERADKWQVGFFTAFDWRHSAHPKSGCKLALSYRNHSTPGQKTGKLTPPATPPVGPNNEKTTVTSPRLK